MVKKILVISIALIAVVGCGGGVGTNSGSTSHNTNNISVDQVLKNNRYLKVSTDADEDFRMSSDGTKIYGISGDTFYIYDTRKIHVWLKKEEETLYAFDTISRVELDLPDGDTVSEPYQTLISSLAVSKDEKTVYLATYDPRHRGAIGSLIILDISDIKNPKVINENTLHLYFDGLKMSPDGKHLLAITSNNHDELHVVLRVIDIQDYKHPKVVSSIQTRGDIDSISVSDDGERAYIATTRSIEIINLEYPTAPVRMQVIPRGYDETTTIVVTKNRKRMYVNSEKVLEVFNIEDDKINLLTSTRIAGDEHYDDIEDLILSDDETRLYAACHDHNKEPNNSLVVFDITDKDKLKFKKKILSPDSYLFAPFSPNQEISPNGKKFYTHSRAYYYIINLEKN